MESKSKLDQDFEDFNLAIRRRAAEEIEKTKSDIDALRVQAAKVGETLEKTLVSKRKES